MNSSKAFGSLFKPAARVWAGVFLLTAACAESPSENDPLTSGPYGQEAGTVTPGTLGGGTDNPGSAGGGSSGGTTLPPIPSGGAAGGSALDGGSGSIKPGSGSDGGVAPASDGGGSQPNTPSADAGAGGDGLSPIAAALPTGKPYGAGWTWVDVPGAVCRDGSPAGYYWRRGKEKPLVIFMNGGGACSDPFFCGINPVNVNQDLPTQSLIDATGNVLAGPDNNRQIPPDEGIFKRDPRNPVGNWNMVYFPYCTGDIFSGSRPDGTIEGVEGKQQFVGYKNVGLFLDSFGPAFGPNAGKVLLTGSSAGGFATLVNYDRVQTFFDKYNARVYGVTDSGVPFRDQYLAPCLQKRWREAWNLNAALPKDCKGCFNADGGGLAEGLGTYMFKEKYKDRILGGMISSAEDGVIRAFYGPGLDNCTKDPGANAIFSALNLGGYGGDTFRAGLRDVLNWLGKDKVHSFVLDSWEHMHLWRARYYETINGTSIAAWLGNVVNDKPAQTVGAP